MQEIQQPNPLQHSSPTPPPSSPPPPFSHDLAAPPPPPSHLTFPFLFPVHPSFSSLYCFLSPSFSSATLSIRSVYPPPTVFPFFHLLFILHIILLFLRASVMEDFGKFVDNPPYPGNTWHHCKLNPISATVLSDPLLEGVQIRASCKDI